MKKLCVYLLLFSLPGWAGASEKAALPTPATGEVTLPLAEYNRLVDLAAKSVKVRELPPVPYTIKRAELKLKAGSASVLGTIALDGEVFSRGASKVPLTSGMTILDAHQQGKALPLEQEGGMSTAILPGAQEFAVQLEAGVPLNIEAGRAWFSLPAPAAGSVRLTLTIPGDRTLVRISPGLITNRKSENGQTVVEATLAPGQTANVYWATREVAPPVVPKEARFLCDVKTLVSIGESDLRVAALADVNIVQGEAQEFTVSVPEGYEITGASGATVESSELQGQTLHLRLSGTQRQQQFLITMERQLTAGKADAPLISFNHAQRETGELLVESAGAAELTAKESGGLKRMDIKEANAQLRSLARYPVQAAFRYHRQPGETPALALEWTRFQDTAVLAAVAERAVVTTLVTVEGRTLTEIKLTVKNQAQPYLKVALPQGASIVTAEVAGEKVKPVEGPDGNRVPLLRPGLRTTEAYEVSFVFMHSGSPFARKGGSELDLPSMDIPISLLQWEVFLPEQYRVKDFGGDAIAMNLLPTLRNVSVSENEGLDQLALFVPGVAGQNANDRTIGGPESKPTVWLLPGQIGGVVVDPQGAVISGAKVTVTSIERGTRKTAVTDSNGWWRVSGMPSGTVKIVAEARGFKSAVYSGTPYDAAHPSPYRIPLYVGDVSTTVEVTSAAPLIDANGPFSNTNGGGFSVNGIRGRSDDKEKDRDAKKQAQQQQAASDNVFNLQKKVAGVLPVRVDVPRAGTSYRFARTLVLEEQTKLTFNYRTK
ncbi:MAG TPA: carboxypeptidase-like regulatory domain-containing protein [Candidatus Angelobacter sp.]